MGANKSVLVAAHGNSLRAICKFLEDMSEEQILEFNIPTAVPLVYELDDNLKFIKKYYLMDERVEGQDGGRGQPGQGQVRSLSGQREEVRKYCVPRRIFLLCCWVCTIHREGACLPSLLSGFAED